MSLAQGLDAKQTAEINYWMDRYTIEGQRFGNEWYKQLMLNVSGMKVADFEGRTVADFGAGPRGSLEWCDNCSKRICIDLLASEYVKLGVADHKAVYVQSTESYIPLPSNYVDIMFTINSLDHVANMEAMTEELFRVIRPGGMLAASLNLNEPSSPAEPQTITQDWVSRAFINGRVVERHKVAPKVSGDVYQYLNQWALGHGDPPALTEGQIGVLWCVVRK